MLDGTDAGALPQFPTPSDRPPARADELDESEVIETVERPPVSIRRITTPPRALTPPRGLVRPARITRDGPPPITAEVEAHDILLEAYVEAPSSTRAPRSRTPLPSAHPAPRSTPRPTLPPPNPPAMRPSTSSEVRSSTSKPWTPAPPRGSASSVRAARPLAPRAPLERHATIPGLAPVKVGASAPPKSVRPASPELRPKDRVEVIAFSSLATTSDRRKAEEAEPAARIDLAPVPRPMDVAAPVSPITRPMLPTASPAERAPGDLPPTSRRPFSMPAIGGSHGSPLETTPSIAPVAMATSLALASRAADPTMQLRRQPRRSTGVVAGMALVVAAVLAGAVVAVVAIVQGGIAGHPTAFFDRLRGHTHDEPRAVAAQSSPPEASVEPPSIAPPAPAPVEPPNVAPLAPAPVDAPGALAPTAPSPLAPSASAAPPSVPVDALPKPSVEPGSTLVTLPRTSKGHRIFVDGRVVGTGPAPVTTKCGTHKVKIGSAGKPRVIDLPCGGELTLD